MTYTEQLEIIKGIPIKEGSTIVIQCPFCGGLKKLAVSKLDGKLKWFCYRASCNGKGIYSDRRNLEATKNYLANTIQKLTREPKPIPEITTSVTNHKKAIDYLDEVNSLEAYEKGYIDIRYAPSEDRVLFYADTGAVGRSLRKYGPKWLTYGTIDSGVHIGSGDIAVVVEDVPSACSVSRINGYVGVALLGTIISTTIKNSLKKYTTVYFVLDKDASRNAIKQSRTVDQKLRVRFTAKDLKSLSTNDVIKVLNE